MRRFQGFASWISYGLCWQKTNVILEASAGNMSSEPPIRRTYLLHTAWRIKREEVATPWQKSCRASCQPPVRKFGLLTLPVLTVTCPVQDLRNPHTPFPVEWLYKESHTSSQKSLATNQYAERLCKRGNSPHSMSNFSVFSLLHLLKVRDYIYHNQIYMDIEKVSLPVYCSEMGWGVERLPSHFLSLC